MSVNKYLQGQKNQVRTHLPGEKRFIVIKISIFLLVFIFIISLLVNLYFIRQNNFDRIGKYAGDDGLNLLNPGVSLINNQDMIVNFQPLRESLKNKYENHEKFNISIYFEYLPTGANISVNTDVQMWPASLIKIPVAMAVMKKIERGEWQLSNELVVMDQDKDSSFGDWHQLPTGTTKTIEEVLKASLVDSDNTAHFMMLRNITDKELEEVFVHLGFDDIIDSLKKNPDSDEYDNRITAKRYTTFFRSLYNATFLLPEYSQLFLSYLEHSPREYLAVGIDESIKFAHKTGIRADDRVWADSGIIYYSNRPYLLTTMIEARPNNSLEEMDVSIIFSEIAKEINDYVAHVN